MHAADNRRVAPVQSELFQPSSVLPSQYFGALGNQTPECRLMIAILQEAIDCIAKHRNARDTCGRRLFAETTYWLLTKQSLWPFSFESICAVLGLDADAVRGALHLGEQPLALASPAARTAIETSADSQGGDAAIKNCDEPGHGAVSKRLRRRPAAQHLDANVLRVAT